MEISTLKATVGRIANRIMDLEQRRKKNSNALRSISELGFRVGNLTDDKIFNKVEKVPLNFVVGGIDGGLLTKTFHGIDIVLTRAVGVIFDYQNGQVVKSKVFPQKMPFIAEVNSGDDGELMTIASLYRMNEEISKAIEVAKTEGLQYLLLDGPLYPHPSTRIAKTTDLKHLYKSVVAKYNELHKVCEDHGVSLVGVVEDSRSKYFSKVLFETLVPGLPNKQQELFSNNFKFRDTALLYDALQVGERTLAFKLSGIQDVTYKLEVFGFYIKTAKYDRPIRIEVASKTPKTTLKKVAQVILSLAAFPSYGIPSVIVEADARAKLSARHMISIQKMLYSKSKSPLVMSLRRENRPV
ncbi:MAG: DNA double-strand break repair nuclease NurA [Candidatus Altiarchaeota archaeon]|nr:DNA double-strand break repair nuclease NurA [Candidatus Altiarchaeota archaeon]